MNSQELFEQFNVSGQLRLPTGTIQFRELPWNKHPTFGGVKFEHLVILVLKIQLYQVRDFPLIVNY